MKLLGMTLWPEKVSDEQYVERLRKGLRSSLRYRYVMSTLGLIIFLWAICLAVWVGRILVNSYAVAHWLANGQPTPSQEVLYGTFSCSIVLGSLLGFLFYSGVFSIVRGYFGFRKDKLLVECWDALSDAEKARLRQRSS